MTQAIQFIFNAFRSLFSFLGSITFELYGYNVSYISVILVLFVVGMVVTIFWKGAKA